MAFAKSYVQLCGSAARFNALVIGRTLSPALGWVTSSRREEHQTMKQLNRNVASTLRRDAEYVGQAAVAIVFFSFATLAVGAALVDLMSINP
jgi:hypothetical protein